MTYVTKDGDLWDWIAFERLGSERYVEALINANRRYAGTVIFEAGVELTLPTIEKEQRQAKLPPWRR